MLHDTLVHNKVEIVNVDQMTQMTLMTWVTQMKPSDPNDSSDLNDPSDWMIGNFLDDWLQFLAADSKCPNVVSCLLSVVYQVEELIAKCLVTVCLLTTNWCGAFRPFFQKKILPKKISQIYSND